MANTGRPTKYTRERLDNAYTYMDTYKEMDEVFPTHEGLFLFIGISSTCGYDWANEEGKEEFSEILAKCNLLQKLQLLNRGLDGTFNSNIAKLVLGKHGIHERKELSGPDGKPIPVLGTEVTAEEASKIYGDFIS